MRTALMILVSAASVSLPAASAAAPTRAPIERVTPYASAQPWCAPEIESLPGDICYLDGASHDQVKKRTLVIFLHGAVAKNTRWSWNHERGILGLAKGNGIEVIFPRSPETEPGFVWPGSLAAQEKVEQELIDSWMRAKKTLEDRDGKAFDEVFLMGFSSGAYFVGSLAFRGRLDVDGYAVFAGGQAMGPAVGRAPVFVGVCADDQTTAAHSRSFVGALRAAAIPRAMSEQHVGHGLSHVHFNGALSYLRHAMRPHLASL